MVTFEGDLPDGAGGEFGGEMEAVEGVEEEEGANTVIEVVGVAAELVEGVGFGEELLEGERLAGGGEGGVAGGGIGVGDEVGEHGREG